MKKILLLLIIAIAGSSLLVTNNAFAVTIQPNVDLNNTQMRYTTSPTTSIQVTSFEIQPNHILLGSTYYDLNSTAGKVFATISSFTEGHDLTIHIDNSSLTDVNMFVLGQLKQVTIDGIAHTIQDRWSYVSGNTITQITVNNGRDVVISFDSVQTGGGGGGGYGSGGGGLTPPDFGSGVAEPPPLTYCDLNPFDASCSIPQPLPSYIDLKIAPASITGNLGQTVSANLVATWTFPSDLTINSIGAASYSSWMTFPAQPFVLKTVQGQSVYKIPVLVKIPAKACSGTSLKSVIDCVNPTTYQIPVRFNGQFYSAKFTYDTTISLKVQQIVSPFFFWLILFIIIILIVVAASRRSGRKGRKEGTFLKNIR